MPRKPKQQRSKATVESIVEAGFLSIAKRGPANTTTRHIAETAGVGVGSLYEYFDNKDAIFDAMCQHFVADIVQLITPIVSELARMNIREAVRSLLQNFQVFLNNDDGKYLRFIQHGMQVDIRNYMAPVNKLLGELVVQHVMRNPEHMKLKNISTMSYIFIHGGMFTVVQHLTDPNPPISFEELVNGLVDMVGHYVAEELFLIEQEQLSQ